MAGFGLEEFSYFALSHLLSFFRLRQNHLITETGISSVISSNSASFPLQLLARRRSVFSVHFWAQLHWGYLLNPDIAKKVW
jgi:hypothetical protein